MLLLLCTVTIKAQVKKTKIYLIHGQGSDARLFSKLTLNVGFDTFCLNLPLPAKGGNMQSFAQQLIPKIDTNIYYKLSQCLFTVITVPAVLSSISLLSVIPIIQLM